VLGATLHHNIALASGAAGGYPRGRGKAPSGGCWGVRIKSAGMDQRRVGPGGGTSRSRAGEMAVRGGACFCWITHGDRCAVRSGDLLWSGLPAAVRRYLASSERDGFCAWRTDRVMHAGGSPGN